MKSDATRDYFKGDVIHDVRSGEGLKFGDYASTKGGAFGWRDITSAVTVRGVGANDPDWAQIGSGPFFAYNFALNDLAWFAFHVPHDLVPAAPIFLHAHWIADGTNVQPVKWEFSHMYARGFAQDAFDTAGSVATAQQTPSGVAYTHMVTETTGITIPDLTEPDGIIYVRVRRVTNDATNNTNNIFLLTADIHYNSHNMPTVNKAPNFYEY